MGSFTRAERRKTFIKLAITGTSGSGKTYSALRLARGLVGETGRIAFIDTENGSATLYDTLTAFDHCQIQPNTSGKFDYTDFIAKVKEAEQMGYDCVIVDSATHLWQGIIADKEELDMGKKGNAFTNWAKPTKNFNTTIQNFLQSRIHLISCMRSKTDHVIDIIDGKSVPRKVGLAPMMRDGIEYEFSIVFDIAINHHAEVSKDRTGMFAKEGNFLITEETGRKIADWLATAKELETADDRRQTAADASGNHSQPAAQPPSPLPSSVSKPPSPHVMWDGSAEFPPPEYDRDAEIENVKRLISGGYLSKDDLTEALKLYECDRVSNLSEGAFESFVLGHVRLVQQIIDETTKRNIPRAKLNEFARLDNEHSFFVSSLATKQKILSLVMEQTIPQQGN
jgi:nucleoside-triphosphatase THEP1